MGVTSESSSIFRFYIKMIYKPYCHKICFPGNAIVSIGQRDIGSAVPLRPHQVDEVDVEAILITLIRRHLMPGLGERLRGCVNGGVAQNRSPSAWLPL
jgi:hypothetical protein